MLKLNNIVDKGSTKSSKRVGRGIGSGKGKTSGAGHKGQKSRSGVAIKGFEGGQMPLHRRLPKRGFKNPFRKEYSTINLVDISKAIDSKKLDPLKEINKDVLAKAGLIRKKTIGIKLLGNGKISHKITIRVNKASKKATDELSKIKGKLILESIKDANDLKEKSSKKKES